MSPIPSLILRPLSIATAGFVAGCLVTCNVSGGQVTKLLLFAGGTAITGFLVEKLWPSKAAVTLPSMPVHYKELVGIYGGLGPKASSTFVDEGLVDGRVTLFNAMQTGQSPEERLENVLQVSTADWKTEEVEKVLAQSQGRTKVVDQDHIPVVMFVNGQTPGRPQYILGESPTDPVPQMAYTCQALMDAGATTLAMVCNTAHYFRFEVEKILLANNPHGPTPRFLDMLELSLQYVVRQYLKKPSSSNANVENDLVVGLLATRATLQTNLFSQVADRLNKDENAKVALKIVTPLTEEGKDKTACQDNVEEAIFGEQGIKTGYHDLDDSVEARRNLKLLLEQALCLVNAGASAIVLGCTELPLVLSHETVTKYASEVLPPGEYDHVISKLMLVNPTQILADEVLHYSLLARD